MLLGAVLLLGILSVPLAGGRLERVAEVRFARTWAIVASLVGQIVVIEILPSGAPALHRTAHLATYGLAAVFIVSNARVPGVLLMGLGGGLNLAAIAANHGVMPARPGAVATAGLTPPPDHFANSAVVGQAHLSWLGDVFAVPAWVPLANVFSVGDVLLLIGALAALHVLAGSRLAPRAALLTPRGRLRAVAVEVVEVGGGAGPALLRLRASGGGWGEPLALIVADERTERVLPALAGPDLAGLEVCAGFALPGGAATLAGCRLTLRRGDRRLALPEPARRRLRGGSAS